jgi:hypothetical protein
MEGAPAAADAGRGNGAPHFEHIVRADWLTSPQFVHFTSSPVASRRISRPDWRALPSFKSPPHCEHTTAFPGLRVPQNPQWISGPTLAAFAAFSSWTSFASAGA